MSKDQNKIQAYVDEKTRLFLAKKADENSISTSKYIAQVLADHVQNDVKQKIYKARVIATLTHILSCVYDPDVSQSNVDVTNSLMASIKEQCKEAFE